MNAAYGVREDTLKTVVVHLMLPLAFFALLGGCATTRSLAISTQPPGHEERLVDPSQAAPRAEMSLSEAQASDKSKPLDLERCIAIALERNPDVRIADAESEAAAHDTRHARGGRLPSVQLQGAYAHSRHPQRLIPPKKIGQTSYFTQDIFSSDIVLRLPLFTGGRIVNEIRAAELMEAAAEQRLAHTREELVFNVSSIYFALLSQHKVIESVEFSLKAMEEHLEQVRHLIEAQKAAKVDRLRSEVRYADLRRQQVEEKNRREIQLRVLSNLMGLEKPLRDADRLVGELSAPEALLDIEESLRTAFETRPDYLARAAEFEAQARRLGSSRAARAPQVYLEGAYGGRWGVGGSGTPASPESRAVTLSRDGSISRAATYGLASGGSLTATHGGQGLQSLRFADSGVGEADSFEEVGRIGVSVSVPLFEGGRISARIARERAKLRAEEERLRKLELQIHLEVESAILNAESALERIVVMEKSADVAEESLRIEQEKYALGMGAIVDVLDAQSALLEAQTKYYQALTAYNTALAELRKATGGPL